MRLKPWAKGNWPRELMKKRSSAHWGLRKELCGTSDTEVYKKSNQHYSINLLEKSLQRLINHRWRDNCPEK